MTFFALFIFALSLLLTWYALWGRAWLKTKPWAQPFFDWIEPVELALYKKSETILFARMKMVTGLLLAALTNIGTIDLTPIMPFVPEKYQGWLHVAFNLAPLMLSIVGWMDEKLRNRTTLPIEVVAVPDKVMAENPVVADAVAKAQDAKVEAVAVVAEQKAAA
jgi:hypothetical protein